MKKTFIFSAFFIFIIFSSVSFAFEPSSNTIYNGIDGPRALIAERKKNPKARAATFISSHMESVALLPAPMIKAKVFGKQFHTICSGGAYMNPAYIDTFQKY